MAVQVMERSGSAWLRWLANFVQAQNTPISIRSLRDPREAALKAVHLPETQKRLEELDATPTEMDQSKFAAQVASETKHNKALMDRSALDAMDLMNVGVNDLREHMPPDARGAALMTDCQVEIVLDKACSNPLLNSTLDRVLHDRLLAKGALTVDAAGHPACLRASRPTIRMQAAPVRPALPAGR